MVKKVSSEVSFEEDWYMSIMSAKSVLSIVPSNLQMMVLPLIVSTRVVARGWVNCMCGAVCGVTSLNVGCLCKRSFLMYLGSP